jgi:3-hydroxypropanoate dehydrogenase
MTMPATLTSIDLETLFHNARTLRKWIDRPVEDATLHAIWDLVKLGPTSSNLQHGRFVFVKSKAAKERLRPCLAEGNVPQTMAAPVTVIAAWDSHFADAAVDLLQRPEIRDWFAGKPEQAIFVEAFRSATLQAAYLILAARATGLDAGPMSGFDPEKTDAVFFPDGRWRSNFLINLGYGDRDGLRPRAPRFAFDQACRIE